MYKFNEFRVRDNMEAALREYQDSGIPLGDFLRAVVTNNFVEACGRADDDNVRNLPAFAGFLWNEMDSRCWGSPTAYEKWLRRHEYIRLLKSMDWTYEASDDHSKWKRGSATRSAAEKLRVEVDANFELWNSMCPPSHVGGKGNWFGEDVS